MLPGRFDALVPLDKALSSIQKTPGLIPVAIEPGRGGRVYWVDIGTQPFADWQFLFTIERLAAQGLISTAFATSIDILDVENLITDAIVPSGFIFHVSRCGSTLLGKALARVPENLVINQGGPLQRGFWAWATHEWEQPLPDTAQTRRMVRNLIAAMARPRLGNEARVFVKFISWNTLYIDFLKRAFPTVPMLFLYRDPVEVIASVIKETTAVLVAKPWLQSGFLTGRPAAQAAQMDDVTYLAHCYANYFKTILMESGENLHVLNYPDLNDRHLGLILDKAFGYLPKNGDISVMCRQFGFHSKDDSDKTTFKRDEQVKREAITHEDQSQIRTITSALLTRLGAVPHNLFKCDNPVDTGAVHAKRKSI